jgi:hypothetical protein
MWGICQTSLVEKREVSRILACRQVVVFWQLVMSMTEHVVRHGQVMSSLICASLLNSS